jgi:hypothetical protein
LAELLGTVIVALVDLPLGTNCIANARFPEYMPEPHPVKIPDIVPLTGFGGTTRRAPPPPAHQPASSLGISTTIVAATAATMQTAVSKLNRENLTCLSVLIVCFSLDADAPLRPKALHHS